MSTINDKLQQLVDKEYNKPNTHSVLLGVHSGDGKINFQGTAGEASPENPYFIASVTKMYTGTVIMQLVDEGKLDLNAPIQQYLSHFSLDGIHVYKGTDYSKQLKVYQLLHQTSGLSDYFDGGLAEDTFKKNADLSYSVEDILDMARNATPFAAPDSGKSHYSDTNYQLLGAIIEVITGQSLVNTFHSRIFVPLGMADTYLFDYNMPPSVEPLPFYNGDTRLSVPLAMTSERGTGGAVSTMTDTLCFLKGYFGGELFDKSNFAQMMQWNAMFFPMHYGYGIWRFKLPRWINLFRETPEFIGHAGANGTMAFYNPKNDIYIVGTLNQMDKPARLFSFMPKVLNVVT